MAFTPQGPFSFQHVSQLDTPAVATSVLKTQWDTQPNELKATVNALIVALEKATATSGADQIGSTAITDLTGANIRAQLISLRDSLKSVVDGSSGADFVNATAIAGINGTTVQAILESLKAYVENTFVTNTNLANTRKLSATGDFTGTLNGQVITATDPGLSTAFNAHMAENVINIKNPPTPLLAAVGDGVTDDTTRIQVLLNHAGANNKSIEIPDRTFLVSALTSGGCKYIFGHGENSVLKTTSVSTILSLSADSTIISGIKFEGTGLDQKGIVNAGKFKCEAVDCIFDNLKGTGGGIFVSGVGTSQHGLLDGMKITNCKFYRCNHGIDCGMNAEYVTIDGCVFQNQCGWAIWAVSGNVLIHGCNITKVRNGIYIAGKEGAVPSNGAHSSITACNINHIFTDNGDGTYTTGYALWFQDVELGEVVSSCAIFDAHIALYNSKGININNSILAIVNYVFDDSDGSCIENCYFYKIYGHNIIPDSSGRPSFVSWINNRTFDGLHGAAIEEIKGGQVKGTITGQVINNAAPETTISITAVSNSANYPNQEKHPWWNSSTNKAKNLGYGGNKLKIDVQFFAEYGAGADVNVTIAFLRVGTEGYALSRTNYGTVNVYYAFNGEVIAEPNEEIYITFLNNSGQNATVTSTNGRFIVEGL